MTAIIPHQKFEVRTRLSPEAARQKLAEIVEPRKLLDEQFETDSFSLT